jgi:hypothetical protein
MTTARPTKRNSKLRTGANEKSPSEQAYTWTPVSLAGVPVIILDRTAYIPSASGGGSFSGTALELVRALTRPPRVAGPVRPRR